MQNLFHLVEYRDAGHIIKLTGLPVLPLATAHKVLKNAYSYGGSVSGNGRAAAIHWQEQRRFLDRLSRNN